MWGRFFRVNGALVLFYVYFALSISWSGDPAGSFKRLVKDFGMLFVIGMLFSEKNPLDAMRAVFIRSACLMLPLSLVFIRWFPSYGRVYALNGAPTYTGVTTQKNTLGELAFIYMMFFIWDFLETRNFGKKWRWWKIPWDHLLLMFMCLWVLRVSESKTALVCLVIGVALLVRWRALATQVINVMVFAGAIASPLLLFFSQHFSSAIAPLVAALGRNMTFTGRANIWEHITLNTVNPLIGCGYYNFWGGPGGYAISIAMDTSVPNAHNGYLDIYLDGGFLGLEVLLILLVAKGIPMIRRSKVLARDNYARISFAFLVVAIVYNLSESTFGRIGLMWFTTLLLIVKFPVVAPLKTAHSTVVRTAKGSFNQEQRVLARLQATNLPVIEVAPTIQGSAIAK